jgi:hypothetical protein
MGLKLCNMPKDRVSSKWWKWDWNAAAGPSSGPELFSMRTLRFSEACGGHMTTGKKVIQKTFPRTFWFL